MVSVADVGDVFAARGAVKEGRAGDDEDGSVDEESKAEGEVGVVSPELDRRPLAWGQEGDNNVLHEVSYQRS